MQSVWEALPVIVMLLAFAFGFKILLDYLTRKKLIEKGMVDENIKFLYADSPESRVLSSLKWAMMSIGVGIAIFIGQMGPPDLVEEYTAGGIFIMGGLGLLLYYLIANKKVSKNKEKETEE
ncbi:MAG: hypothetical protein OEV55_05810 [candidate division Zixibacteria bacterium]|nr:hypothetical protein [candidate division Zixibacteria bacterium]